VGLIGAPQGIRILERYVEDPYKIGEHSVVRAFAAMALGKLGHADAGSRRCRAMAQEILKGEGMSPQTRTALRTIVQYLHLLAVAFGGRNRCGTAL
jgi:hypothetical protein